MIEQLVLVLNTVAIYKTIRSTSPCRRHAREYLYIIQSTTLTGRPIYTKGKLIAEGGVETYYCAATLRHIGIVASGLPFVSFR